MLYLSVKEDGVLAEKVAIIYHPSEKSRLEDILNYRKMNIFYTAKPQIVESGVSVLTAARWKYFDSVVVLPCHTKLLKNYCKRLLVYRDAFRSLMNDGKIALHFCGNSVNLIADKIFNVPEGNVFCNDKVKSANIDIETNGLNLINTWYDTLGFTNANSPRYKVLSYLSNTRPIYITNESVEYGRTFHGDLYEFKNEKLTNLSIDEYSSLFHSDNSKKKIKPITPIFKEEE